MPAKNHLTPEQKENPQKSLSWIPNINAIDSEEPDLLL